MNIKNYIVAIALFVVVAPSAFAAHVATDDGVRCGKMVLTGELIPHCENGAPMPNTSWVVYQPRTFVNGVSAEAEKAIAVVNSAAEAYRLEMLALARHLLAQPVKYNWKGTMIQQWLDRVVAGER